MSTAKELGDQIKASLAGTASHSDEQAIRAIDTLVSLAPAETAAGVPVGWIFEYGAVSLPQGHPARITIRKFFDFEFEAKEEAVGIDYDSVIYPVFASPQPPATHKGAWISVEERLPEANAIVLLWVKADKEDEDADGNVYLRDVSYVDFGHWQPSHCGGAGYFDNYACNFEDRKVVTHWMPLPEPPGIPKESA